MPPQDHRDDLTAREREVLDLVRLGLTNEEIAGRLGITEAGAKYHVSQILSKLGVATREEAAALYATATHVAEAFQPRRGRWWAALPLAAKAASVAVILAAVGGLGLLAWGVLRTDDDVTVSAGEIVLVSHGNSGDQIWLMDANGDNLRQVTTMPPMNYEPALSLDGHRIVFASQAGRDYTDLYLINADGSGLQQLTDTPNSAESSPSFLPDAKTIVYIRNGAVYSIEESGKNERPLGLRGFTVDVSPDGSTIAYTAGVMGLHYEAPSVSIRDLDGGTSRRLTAEMEYTAFPEWSPDGRSIAMLCGREALVSIPLAPTPVDPVGICVVDADGSNLRKIVDLPSRPTWTPDGRWIAFTGGVDGISLIRSDGKDLHQIPVDAANLSLR